MPAIYLFQKRTFLGGDDLQFPALVTILVRILQMIGLIGPMTYFLLQDAAASSNVANSNHQNFMEYVLVDPVGEECHNSHFFPLLMSMYLGASTLFGIWSVVLEQRIWYWASQGTPTTHREPRTSRIETLLETRLFVMAVLQMLIVITYISATVFFTKTYLHCHRHRANNNSDDDDDYYNNDGDMDDYPNYNHNHNNGYGGNGGIYEDEGTTHKKLWVGSHAWWITSSLLILSQVAETFLTALFWVRLYHSQHHQQQQQQQQHFHHQNQNHPHELTEELWADRCHWLCQCLSVSTCCLFGGQDLVNNPNSVPYYEHVARALADYLETKGTLDVVPTDLATGLLVLQRLQRQRILQARFYVVVAQQQSRQSMITNHPTATATATAATSTEPATTFGFRRLVVDVEHQAAITALSPSPKSAPSSATGVRSSSNHNKPSSSSSTLRSRTSSSNDLGIQSAFATPQLLQQNRTSPSSTTIRPTTTTTTTAAATMGITHNSSASSMDLPETTRLVTSSAARQQPIYRRITAANNNNNNNNNNGFYQQQSRQVLNPQNPVDCQRLKEGARMAKFALAIYTWMLYVFVHPIKGVPILCCRTCQLCRQCPLERRRRRRRRRRSEESLLGEDDEEEGSGDHYDDDATTVGDNICQWHKHSLLLVAGLPEADLIYAQFHNSFSLVPYCILLDHESQSVVVSIRGSLSLEDLVTDVMIDPEPMDDLGQEFGFEDIATGQYCHAGVVACAQNVHQDLQQHGILEQLLGQDYPQYQLRLVGHSLGAATCTLLGYMLRPRFPTLRVFNYSPPGCSMTWELATRCEPWATTFVLDSDLVPRLSVSHLENLRDEILKLIGRLKVPKYQVVQSFWETSRRKFCCGAAGGRGTTSEDLEELNELIDNLLLEDSPSPETNIYQRQLLEFLQVQEQLKEHRGNSRRLKLYPPGRMIHLLKTGEKGGCGHVARKFVTCCTSNAGFQYTPVYIANDDLDEIVVSPTMGTDHFVDRMHDELNGLAQEYSFFSVRGEGSENIGIV